MAVIDLRDIAFSYADGRSVLDGLSFRLEPGERVGLVAPNGSGKTTLFHLIVGLLQPLAGEVEVFGQTRVREEDFLEVRSRVGLLFQDADDQLFCPTVAEDVAFGPMNLGKGREETARIVADTLGLLGLEGFEERVTHHLSGGEKRLVSLATILAMSPEVLLLDEPTAGLDENTVERLTAVLAEQAPSHITISHDQDFLRRTTDKTCTLREGRMVPA
ncbi:energy-coupling factor ABC transporter ATP-binding protein [Candidatus Latescibacterota bacterium]